MNSAVTWSMFFAKYRTRQFQWFQCKSHFIDNPMALVGETLLSYKVEQ